jgi:hypothetical protein
VFLVVVYRQRRLKHYRSINCLFKQRLGTVASLAVGVNGKVMNLTERLRKAILTSKQSRYAIAIGAGIDHAVLRRFVHGERDITLGTAEHLAEYLGLELAQKKTRKKKKD